MLRGKLLLAVSLSVATWLSTVAPSALASTSSAQSTASSSSLAGYTKDEIAVLNKLNFYRSKIGIPPVQFKKLLFKTSFDHANYVWLNNSYMSEGHYETKGKPGFTGVGPSDRVLALDPMFPADTEVMAGDEPSMIHAFNDLMNAPLHREAMLDPNDEYIGMALYHGTYVMDIEQYSGYNPKTGAMYSLYPYNGEKNVPISFNGHEIPDPLAGFHVKVSGYPVDFQEPAPFYTYINQNNMGFVLKDSKGNVIPVFKYSYDDGIQDVFLPKKPLKYDETYTASVNFTSRTLNSLTPSHVQETWSFTTMKNPIPVPKKVIIPSVLLGTTYPSYNHGKPIGDLLCLTTKLIAETYGNNEIVMRFKKGHSYQVLKYSNGFLDARGLGELNIYWNDDVNTIFFIGTLINKTSQLQLLDKFGNVVHSYPKGYSVRVTAKDGDWYKVQGGYYVEASPSIQYNPIA